MIRDVHPGSQIQGSKKGTGSRSQIRIRYTAVECHDINGISFLCTFSRAEKVILHKAANRFAKEAYKEETLIQFYLSMQIRIQGAKPMRIWPGSWSNFKSEKVDFSHKNYS
jgi:hypothetical protein